MSFTFNFPKSKLIINNCHSRVIFHTFSLIYVSALFCMKLIFFFRPIFVCLFVEWSRQRTQVSMKHLLQFQFRYIFLFHSTTNSFFFEIDHKNFPMLRIFYLHEQRKENKLNGVRMVKILCDDR